MTRTRLLALATATAVLYVIAYVGYRSSHTETWEQDGRKYVIFGSRASYYLFRPASYVDGKITGMSFHIGPHR